MSEKTVTKQELVNDIAAAEGCTKRAAADFLESFCDIVAGYLKTGRGVRLTHLGRVYVKQVNPRTAYNPRNRDVKIEVPARMRAKFSASKSMQAELDALPTE